MVSPASSVETFTAKSTKTGRTSSPAVVPWAKAVQAVKGLLATFNIRMHQTGIFSPGTQGFFPQTDLWRPDPAIWKDDQQTMHHLEQLHIPIIPHNVRPRPEPDLLLHDLGSGIAMNSDFEAKLQYIMESKHW